LITLESPKIENSSSSIYEMNILVNKFM